MWKLLGLLLLLSLVPLQESLSYQDLTKEQLYQELETIFEELEKIQLQLEDGSKITMSELVMLRVNLKKAENELIELKNNNREILKHNTSLQTSLAKAERLLKNLETEILIIKIKYFMAGLGIGILGGYFIWS